MVFGLADPPGLLAQLVSQTSPGPERRRHAAVALVNYVPVELAIALLSLVFFGQQSWSTLVMVLPADLFPRGIVGSVAGLVGFGGAMGGVVFGLIAGRLLDHGFGYSTLFAIVSTLHVIAFLLILSTVRAARFSKTSRQ